MGWEAAQKKYKLEMQKGSSDLETKKWQQENKALLHNEGERNVIEAQAEIELNSLCWG